MVGDCSMMGYGWWLVQAAFGMVVQGSGGCWDYFGYGCPCKKREGIGCPPEGKELAGGSNYRERASRALISSLTVAMSVHSSILDSTPKSFATSLVKLT